MTLLETLRKIALHAGALADALASSPDDSPLPGTDPTDPPATIPPPAPTGYDLTTHGALVEGYAGLFPSGSPLVGLAGGPIDLPNTEGITPYGLPRANDGVAGSGFCIEWQAALIPPADGLYQFRVAARPGGRVILDDSVAWSDSGATNAWTWDYFERTLNKGEVYPISALCAAARSGGCGFQLRWRCKEAGIHGAITDEADVAGYASERGYSDIDTFYLRPPADWKTRLKTYVPPPIVPGPQPQYDIIIPKLADAAYIPSDLPADLMESVLFQPWMTDVSLEPVDPLSGAYIASLGRFNLQADFGPGFGIPFELVGSDTPRQIVTVVDVPHESDPGPWQIPLPPTVESGAAGGNPYKGDVHWQGLNLDARAIESLYQLRQQSSDQKWHCYQGTRWYLDKPYDQRPLGWTSEDASGNPLLHLLARFQNFLAGRLQPIRGTVGLTQKGFCRLARHFTNKTTDPHVLPMGAVIRIKAAVDLSKLGPQARWVCECGKKHGFPVQDNGSNSKLFISGTPDARWDVNDLAGFKSLPTDAFEVALTGPITRVV